MAKSRHNFYLFFTKNKNGCVDLLIVACYNVSVLKCETAMRARMWICGQWSEPERTETGAGIGIGIGIGIGAG